MNPEDVTALIILAVTHFVGGIAAFGSSLLAVPFLLLLYGASELGPVLFVIVVAGLLQSTFLVIKNWQNTDVRSCAILLVGAACGIPVGMRVVDSLPEQGIMLLLGALTLIAGVIPFFHPGGERRLPAALTAAVAVVSGIIHGAFASGGTVLVAYVQQLIPDRDRFRATLAMFWTLLNAGFVVALFFRTNADSELWSRTGVACAVVLAVSFSANRIAGRMNRQWFQRLISGLLIISGVVLLGRQLL